MNYLTANHLNKGAVSYTSGGSGILPCYVGTVTQALIKMGAFDTELVLSSIQWLVDHQRFDTASPKIGVTSTGGQSHERDELVGKHSVRIGGGSSSVVGS